LEINTEKGMEEFQQVMGDGAVGPEAQMAAGLMGDMTGMAPPGSDEAMAFGKILEYIEDSSYDRVIFDTLLELPDLLDSWLGKILTMRQRLSSMMSGLKGMFGGGDQEDTSWQMIQQTKDKIRAARIELSDPDTTQFVVVTIPEAMAVFETQRLLTSLGSWHIPATHLIVNQLVPPNPDCKFCSKRHEMQQTNMKDIRELYSDMDLTEVPQFDGEIRGLEGLTELGKILLGDSEE
jgi:arsenite-transporting ATPase